MKITNRFVLQVADVDPRTTTHTVTKLIENTEYMFRVIAQNSVGASEPLNSEPVLVRIYYGNRFVVDRRQFVM